MNNDIIGKNIRKYRELKGYSQEYMAHELDLTQASYAKLVETENAEFAKLRATAERASAQLEQKQQMKAKIEERIAKIEGAANAKYFKEQYSSLVKEYNNVVKALDQEINALSKTVDNYNTILQLKEGSGQ